MRGPGDEHGEAANLTEVARAASTPTRAADDERFFAALSEVTHFDEVVRRQNYADAPESWYVVITDVKGSTRAIEQGRYRDVNTLGVASIIAVKNAAPELELPFVFGGDGATLLVPGTRLDAVDRAMRGARELARSAFDLDLRIGRVAIAELRRAGRSIRVERFRLSPAVALAMFSGNGFQVAEAWVKDPASAARYSVPDGPADADFEGFECRWQPMKSQRGEIVSILVVALGVDDEKREHVYANTLSKLDRVLDGKQACPVSLRAMRMTGLFGDFSSEARVRSQHTEGPEYDAAASEARKKTLIARALIAAKKEAGGFDGGTYLREFVQNTDFRKFDDTLRLVLDLTPSESSELERWLEDAYRRRQLVYGLHRSEAALATCMVKAYEGDHVHFIDGANGGYALAAKGMKQRLATVETDPG